MKKDARRNLTVTVSDLTEGKKLRTNEKTSQIPARRRFLRASLIGSVATAAVPALRPWVTSARELSPAAKVAEVSAFEFEEITIAELQESMKAGKHTALSIAEKYLGRIDAVDKHGPGVNSVIETNPDALAIAGALDKERKEKGPRGPLHGIPILIKDNIDTHDRMMTTAGSLALLGSTPPKDSFVAKKLREAGAVILGKTNLSEWANIRSTHSSSGWSGRGGQTKNPYALDRNPCGSSSGSGAAASANLCAGTIGTETDGSIVCPSSANGLAGIKPTVGLVSRAGIIPISHTQDGAGPMCRHMSDAAAILGALTGIDPEDSATAASRAKFLTDYTAFLNPDGLKGARIGVLRKSFGFNPKVDKVMEASLEVLKKQGATLVDPVALESLEKVRESEFMCFMYELKADLNAYLARLEPNAPVKTLKDIIEFNEKNREKEMPFFGQEIFLQAQEKGPLTTKEYVDAIEKNQRLARNEGIDMVMDKFKLDAIVGPTGGPAWLTDHINGDSFGGGTSQPAAVAGYPDITVVAGHISGLPVGISFFGRAWSEPVLIKLAYALEQATKVRKAPRFLSTADAQV
jgi:amidase